MQIYSVILAGGLGKRLKPLSTADKPKQFHDFFGSGETLLQQSLLRAAEFSKIGKIYTIGNIHHHKILNQQLRGIDERLTNKIIYEPNPNNTAASIFLAAKIVKKGIMVIAPSDHFIEGDFCGAVQQAAQIAQAGKIVTFGIKPYEPSENYGYILNDKFLEKPNAKLAEKLIEQGAVWNSGIFVAKAETLLAEFKKHAPEFFASSFANMPQLPFDKAVMEKTKNIHCLTANFEWDDLGSWERLAKHGCEVAKEHLL